MDRLASLAAHLAYPVSAVVLVGIGIYGLVRAARASRSVGPGFVIALVIWAACVGYLTLVMHGHGARLNLVPFNFFGNPAQPVLNILLFLPLGILLATIGWRWFALLGLGFVLSLSIEVTQYLMNDGRTADVNDVMMNALGAVLGAVVVAALRTRLRERSQMNSYEVR